MKLKTSLVHRLRQWTDAHSTLLHDQGVSIIDKMPAEADETQDKGCIGLSNGQIMASFTVWDREDRETIQVDIIVYNVSRDQTILMEDYEVPFNHDIIVDLESLASRVSSREFDTLQADPKLTVT